MTMQLLYSTRFQRSYDAAPEEIRRAFDRRSTFLQANLRHPSLQTKKYDEQRGIWQARVNDDWRFYFTITQDCYNLIDIMKHPK